MPFPFGPLQPGRNVPQPASPSTPAPVVPNRTPQPNSDVPPPIPIRKGGLGQPFVPEPGIGRDSYGGGLGPIQRRGIFPQSEPPKG